ncbi:MAG: NDP-sugar synthase [Candidatus Methanofastidiosa archaeon]|jgi:glucose-1-phosphate thymidylyltransferase|nr:NDP-sugar synthase [Candidatus Methanofastidiosa archaeon]
MIGLVLAGGFAKRMSPLAYSKPLLPIGPSPCIQHVCEKINEIESITKVYITTADFFKEDYESWLDSINFNSKYELVFEKSKSDKEKPGALKSICQFVSSKKINEDILIVAGDNYFDFSLQPIIKAYEKESLLTVGLYDLENFELIKKYSSVVLDSKNKIIKFEEKPKNPNSTLISMACYIYPKTFLEHLDKATKSGIVDSPGRIIEYALKEEVKICGVKLDGNWIDIGDLFSYLKANAQELKGEKYIDTSSKVENCKIGKNVYIGKGCTIKNCEIDNSVILQGCTINSSKIVNSIIGTKNAFRNKDILNSIQDNSYTVH